MGRTVFIVFALLAFFLATSHGDKFDCDNALKDIKARLDAFSNYVPPSPPAPTKKPSDSDMGGGMDGMDSDMGGGSGMSRDTSLPTDCLNANWTQVNCNSHLCIAALLDLVEDFDNIFDETCTPAHGDVVDDETKAVIDLLRNMPTCNKCVVSYLKFTKLEETIKQDKCLPSETTHTCDSDCVLNLEKYYGLWEQMLSVQCHMNNPGGCGDMGGPTEGEIYDKVNNMHPIMRRVLTVITYCKPECSSLTDVWYQEWKPLISQNCISSTEVELSKANLLLQEFDLELQCTQDCRAKLETLTVQSYAKIPTLCAKGLTEIHKDALVDSKNPDRCEKEEDSWSMLSEVTVAQAFFGLGLLGVGAIVIYLIGGVVYNRCVLGKRGWEMVPSFWWGRKKNTHQRLPTSDDEEEMLFENNEDDRL